ncbi:MAG: small basic protein [Planctomycetia bacterium]|nr:small basic protein [Planctomycetia bacterium]
MSIDKSLRRKNSLARARNVLTRAERVKVLQDEERWKEGRSPFGLPKVRVLKVVIKKAKKAKDEEKAADGAAAPAAGDKKGAAPAGDKKAAAPAAAKKPAGGDKKK